MGGTCGNPCPVVDREMGTIFLLIPCDHIEAETKRTYSHVVYSDDHGCTWELGGRTPQYLVNECEVVELTGDRLILNMRNYDPRWQARQVSISLQ
jgi:sialidase-1